MLQSRLNMLKLFLILIFFSISPGYALEKKHWGGATDKMGSVSVVHTIPANKTFILQAFILLKENWRPVPVFWNKQKIWFDLGPEFRNLPYKINLVVY